MQFSDVSNELHKRIVRKFPRRKVLVFGPNEIWAMDLMDMIAHEKQNSGFKYIYCIIDVFTKFAWIIPLKDKQATTVLNAFKKVITTSKWKPKKIWTDKGTEFYNSNMTAYLDKQKITIYSTYSESKSVVVERFNKSIKLWIWKHFTSKNTRDWVTFLPKLQTFYNNRKHSSIGMSPQNATNPTNTQQVFDKLFGPYFSNLVEGETKPTKFKVGEYVRISRIKDTFEKGYDANWSRAVYTIREVIDSKPTTYLLSEYDKTPIDGGFYEQELQKTTNPEFFEVEKILQERKRKGKKEYLIKWLGYEDKYNSYVSEKDLKDLQK